MKKRYGRIVSVLLCAAMLASMAAGCGSGGETSTSTSSGSSSGGSTEKLTDASFAEGGNWEELLEAAEDSSDLPDFEGETLTLRFWMGHGNEVMDRVESELDVVSPEIERIFGIKMDVDNSFDNQGEDFAAAILKRAASNDFPDIGYGMTAVPDLIDADKLYETKESGLLEKYAPNIYDAVQKTQPETWDVGYNGTGKQYGLPVDYNGTAENVKALWPDVDLEKYANIAAPEDAMGAYHSVMVRDDILKLAYPEAKTQKEIEELYAEKGSFTREDIYDVPVSSKEEINEFFYKIRDAINENNITEDGRPVYATYVADGSGETWALLNVEAPIWNGLPNSSNLTYFQPSSQTIQFGMYQPYYKEDMKMFTKWVQDGVAPEACLVDQAEQFQSKINNGEYAVVYAYHQFSMNLAEGKDYQYRKVYFDIPVNNEKFVTNRAENTGNMISIFKDSVSEEELPRVMRFLDFLATDVGMLLTCWGPYDEENGLWEYTEDGGRKFKEEYSALEDELVYGATTKEYQKYNLANPNEVFREGATPAWPRFYTLVNTGGIYSPAYMYDRDPARDGEVDVNKFFTSGLFDTLPKTKEVVTNNCDIWTFTNDVEGLKNFDSVRTKAVDPLLLKVFTAENDAQFEEYFQDVLDYCQETGVNDDALKQCEEVMKEKYPDSWERYCEGVG